ncbi:microtubule-destabilizing protein 60-like [Curcuma longa]|uniref:microtubule-destabilizing protein 60-like n=1 Tax=Curcuma longa TaxID=136217 RepID=UPI003D9E99E3
MAATPSKNLQRCRSHLLEAPMASENPDPNIPPPSPLSAHKPARSPAVGSDESKGSGSKTRGRIFDPPPVPGRARKFIVAKKSSRRAGNGIDFEKCRKEAYETLRASQEEFLKINRSYGVAGVVNPGDVEAGVSVDGNNKEEVNGTREILDSGTEDTEDCSEARKLRDLVKEEAPEPVSGRVKHLVKAFENFLSISKDDDAEKSENGDLNAMNWTLPGLQQSSETEAAETSFAYVFSSSEFIPSIKPVREPQLNSLVDENGERPSLGRGTSGEGRIKRSVRKSCILHSSDSLRRSWDKMLKVTSQHPFKLRTEQRGRIKEEQFIKKVKEMLVEEEKQRIPIAQGLPWTIDEPEILLKPPIKESTEPLDIVLHSDVRAVERAGFDKFVAERLSFAEQLRLEREMQQKFEEEEEIRRLKRKLVPKAQSMPYFDRPFVPKRSEKPRTIPKEPSFRIHPKKSSCASRFK